MIRIWATAIFCVLTLSQATLAQAKECVWTGNGSNDFWSNEDNWRDDNVPANGDTLLFTENPQTGDVNRTANRNDIVGLQIAGVRINKVYYGSRNWAFHGQAITLTGSIVIDSFEHFLPWFALPINLGANVKVALLRAGRLTLSHVDLSGFDLEIAGGSVLLERVSGQGTLVSGDSASTVIEDGSYTGATLIHSGVLSASGETALGAAGPGNETYVIGGQLRVFSHTYNESLWINGGSSSSAALQSGGLARLNGPITITNGAVLDAGSDCNCSLFLAGPVTGGHLRVNGGTLRVSNPGNAWASLDIGSATVVLEASGVLPDASPVDGFGTLDLRRFSEAIGPLSGGLRIRFGNTALTVDQTTARDFSGVLDGAGSFIKKGAERLTVSGGGPNTFTGSTIVEAGALRLARQPDQTGNATVAIGPVIVTGGLLETTWSNQLADASATVTLQAPGSWRVSAHETIASLDGDGSITFARERSNEAPALTVGANNTSTTYRGTITGEGAFPLTKAGSGTLTLTGHHTYSGGTRVTAGTLMVLGSLNRSMPVAVDGGVLAGTGVIGDLTGTDGATVGAVSPGASAGILTAASASLGGPFIVELHGPEAGASFDQLALSGDLNLTETASLQLSLGFRPRQGTRFPIVTLPAGKTITGTFADLPEGAKLSFEGRTFGITYHGGEDGNDIVLTALDIDGNVPTVIITAPTTAPAVKASTALIALAGGASDAAGVARVEWTNDRGGRGVATGTTAWSVPSVSIAPGTNVITVTAFNTNGYAASATLTVTLDTLTYYLAEGAASAFFATDLLIANPNNIPVPAVVRFLRADGFTVTQPLTLVPTSQQLIVVNAIPGLESAEFSTTVESPEGHPLIVERTMRWGTGGYGAHTERAAEAPSSRWYFAEGAQGFYQTYVLLANPSAESNRAVVEFLLEDGEPVRRDIELAPTSRFSLYAGALPELASRAFGITVTFLDAPGMAERAMYFGDPLFNGGHDAAGITEPSSTWLFAEGATGGFFTTYILIANPGDEPAEVTTRFLPEGGAPVSRTFTLPAHRRHTINVAGEGPTLAAASVATEVRSTKPVMAERAMYWPGGPATWYEAHASAGVAAHGMRWGLAEGRVGGPEAYQTFILLANPGDLPAFVTMTFLRQDGTTVVKTRTVAANARVTMDVGGEVPELRDEAFGTLITADQPIAVERALYASVDGVRWAAGTNATGTRLP